MTKNQTIIQKRYKELWSWYGTATETANFTQYKMHGYLKKFVEKVKLFQMSLYPKRYFVIDFQLAILQIQKDKKVKFDDPNNKKVLFRDILDCYLPKKDVSYDLPGKWKHVFYLKTTERIYILCAKCEEDRNMWMAGFRYIIASTVTVQEIMKNNDIQLQKKMKEKTQKLLEVGKKVQQVHRPN